MEEEKRAVASQIQIYALKYEGLLLSRLVSRVQSWCSSEESNESSRQISLRAGSAKTNFSSFLIDFGWLPIGF
jgi:hypothetical protein